jgi:hypothetical protein
MEKKDSCDFISKNQCVGIPYFGWRTEIKRPNSSGCSGRSDFAPVEAL